MNSDIELFYLSEDDLNSPEFLEYVRENKPGHEEEFLNRMRWYFQTDNFKLLVARFEGKIVGQSCGYGATAVVHGVETIISWSVDTLVNPNIRGKGIGKKLQKKLHEDCPNFSSAWYSPTNGHIKQKCGARQIFPYPFTYYPVSRFFSVLGSLGIKKRFRGFKGFRIAIPNIYYYLNKLWSRKISGYTISEVPFEQLSEDIAAFMERNLQDRDFHIKRSLQYLKWKYGQGNGFEYAMLEVRKEGKLEAIVSFTLPRKATLILTACTFTKILDAVIDKSCCLTMRDLHFIVMRYCKQHKMPIDGIVSLENVSIYPKLTYPYPCSYVLSTLDVKEKIERPYLSCIDQDMEQM